MKQLNYESGLAKPLQCLEDNQENPLYDVCYHDYTENSLCETCVHQNSDTCQNEQEVCFYEPFEKDW